MTIGRLRFRTVMGLGGAATVALSVLSLATGASGQVAGPAAHLSQTAAAASRPSAKTLAVMHNLFRTRAAHGSTRLGGLTGMVSGVAGAPLTGTCVTARGPGGTATGMTRSNGRFLLTRLRPGWYSLKFSDCASPGRYFDQWYRGGGVPAEGQRVAVIPGRVTTLKDVHMISTLPSQRFASLPTATVRPGSASRGGSISGKVTSKSGKPLAGICAFGLMQTRHSEFGFETATNSRGRYRLPGLKPGRYLVGFFTGCGNRGNYAPRFWKNAATPRKATKVRVAAGKSVTGINEVLPPGAEISGTVRLRNKFGRPLGGICVAAVQTGGGGLGIFALAATNRHGAYLLKGLPTGKYQIEFGPGCRNNGNYLDSFFHGKVQATEGKVTSGINGYLQPGGRITGVVTDSHGNPVRGVCVLAQSTFSGGFGQTSRNGTYSIPQLTTGSYFVAFSGGCGSKGSLAPQYYRGHTQDLAANPVAVVAGQTTAGIGAALQPGAIITGQVTSASGQPLGGVCVGAGTPLLTQFGFVNALSETGPDGSYQLTDLAPGQYQVVFFPGCGFNANDASQWYKSSPGPAGSSLVSAAGGTPTAGIDAAMQAAGSMSGTITSAATKRPLANICAFATDLHSGAGNAWITGRHGVYKLGGLAPGKYLVEFSPCGGQDYADQYYRGRPTPAGATLVTITAHHVTTGIGGALTRGGSLSGVMRSSVTHLPQRNGCVLAFDPSTGAFGFASTGKHGHYRMSPMDTGNYLIEYGLCFQGNSDLAVAILPNRVHVTAPGAVTGVNLTLRPGGGISGQLTSGASKARPAAEVCVEVIPVSGDGAGGFTETTRGGGYLTRGIIPGKYDVYFSPDDCAFNPIGLAPQWYKGQPTQATATPVIIKADVTQAGINDTLRHRGRIQGTVTDQSNTPLTGICVAAVPDGGGTPVVATTANGSYSIMNLLPGKYRVEFSSGCGGSTAYLTQWYNGASSEGSATVITVPGGTTVTGIGAAMAPGP